MSIRSERVTITRIATGYMIEKDRGDYTLTQSAFPTWTEAAQFVDNNQPNLVDVKYGKDGEETEIKVIK